MEEVGTQTFGTSVTVGSLSTDIKNGSMTISDVTVANPPGYKNVNAFTLRGIEAAVNFENFDIKRIIVDKPDIVIEEKNGETNFTELLSGMARKEFRLMRPAYGVSNSQLDPYFGGVHALAKEKGAWNGAADPRRDGVVGRAWRVEE